ncbi:hypothetical protein F5X99DRAFT_48545 [Biscogniauxia marginata]|nr:hypothetical protein F5X99DRAFT_48545 [Biscogniauxia marginata]
MLHHCLLCMSDFHLTPPLSSCSSKGFGKCLSSEHVGFSTHLFSVIVKRPPHVTRRLPYCPVTIRAPCSVELGWLKSWTQLLGYQPSSRLELAPGRSSSVRRVSSFPPSLTWTTVKLGPSLSPSRYTVLVFLACNRSRLHLHHNVHRPASPPTSCPDSFRIVRIGQVRISPSAPRATPPPLSNKKGEEEEKLWSWPHHKSCNSEMCRSRAGQRTSGNLDTTEWISPKD